MTIHDIKPTQRAEAPDPPPDEQHSRSDKTVIAIVIAACVIAAVIIGYLLLRPVNDPTPPKPQPPVDTRVADEAAALDVAKKLPDATDAERDTIVDGPLAESARATEADWKKRGLKVVGTPIYSYKVRDYAATPDTRVVISRCADLSKSKLVDAKGNRADAPPGGGKPYIWTHSLMIVTQQGDGHWLITSLSVTQKEVTGSCSLDTPL